MGAEGRDAEKVRKDAEHCLKCKQQEENTPLMVYQLEVRANLAIDRDYYRKLEAAKEESKPRGAFGGGSQLPPYMLREIRAAKARAEAAGRPIEKLSLKIIQNIMHGRI